MKSKKLMSLALAFVITFSLAFTALMRGASITKVDAATVTAADLISAADNYLKKQKGIKITRTTSFDSTMVVLFRQSIEGAKDPNAYKEVPAVVEAKNTTTETIKADTGTEYSTGTNKIVSSYTIDATTVKETQTIKSKSYVQLSKKGYAKYIYDADSKEWFKLSSTDKTYTVMQMLSTLSKANLKNLKITKTTDTGYVVKGTLKSKTFFSNVIDTDTAITANVTLTFDKKTKQLKMLKIAIPGEFLTSRNGVDVNLSNITITYKIKGVTTAEVSVPSSVQKNAIAVSME